MSNAALRLKRPQDCKKRIDDEPRAARPGRTPGFQAAGGARACAPAQGGAVCSAVAATAASASAASTGTGGAGAAAGSAGMAP